MSHRRGRSHRGHCRVEELRSQKCRTSGHSFGLKGFILVSVLYNTVQHKSFFFFLRKVFFFGKKKQNFFLRYESHDLGKVHNSTKEVRKPMTFSLSPESYASYFLRLRKNTQIFNYNTETMNM